MICDDAELTLALASMGDVEAELLLQARAHAQACDRCAPAERDYADMLDLIARAAVPGGPPPELRRRILDAVSPQPQPNAQRSAEPEQPAQWRGAAERPWWQRLWDRVPTGRALTALAFGASAAAVVLAAVLVFTTHAPSPVVTQPVQAGVNQQGLSGTLTYYRGTGDAVVSLRGLAAGPHTTTGAPAVYELWLTRSGGGVAPAGLLAQQPDGTWRAVVHRQASADVAVAATVEPAPGTQSPTGAEVFQVNLPQT